MSEFLIAWYNRNVVAGWYMSAAMFTGFAAAAAPYLIDMADGLLTSWDVMTASAPVSPTTKEGVRLALLLIVLPLAKAWKQKAMQKAALKQAAENGDVASAMDTDKVLVAVPGTDAVLVAPK